MAIYLGKYPNGDLAQFHCSGRPTRANTDGRFVSATGPSPANWQPPTTPAMATPTPKCAPAPTRNAWLAKTPTRSGKSSANRSNLRCRCRLKSWLNGTDARPQNTNQTNPCLVQLMYRICSARHGFWKIFTRSKTKDDPRPVHKPRVISRMRSTISAVEFLQSSAAI